MKKNIAIAGIFLAMVLSTGCGRFVARKDENQIVTFKNSQIKKDFYTVKLYRLNYPKSPYEKDEFYKKFDVLVSKMIAHKKDINLVIPFELYEDFLNLKKSEVRTGEKTFGKPAYTLSKDDMLLIDEKVKVDYPKDAGTTQIYLNKQVAYWYEYLKRGYEYDKTKYYTELDKNRLIGEVLKNRSLFSDTTLLVERDYALEVEEPDMERAGATGLPLYIRGNADIDKIKDSKSNVIIADGNVKDQVIPGKILLLNGKTVANIKDYRIKTLVESVRSPYDLIPLLEEQDGLKLKDIEDFQIKKISSLEPPKADVSEEESPRQGINFIKIESKWRLDK